MNILASYQWIKEYVSLKETPEEFAAKVSLSGPGVERLYPQAPLYEGMFVGHVRSIETHPNADKLRLAKVSLGTREIVVVCGGSNLQVNQWVVVALPGANVRWHGEGELIELKPTEIRGVASEGMICAANEVGLFDAFPHTEKEILDLGQAFSKESKTFKAGQSLSAFLEVDHDVIADIEVTTNRPDAMSIVGLAREAATILQHPFIWKAPKLKEGKEKLIVHVTEKKNCARFMAIRIDGVTVGPSPWWMKRRLLSAGQRPINNLVDITNYILLELGRPMHVFDANKLQGGLSVRCAKSGETLKALDGKTYELVPHHVVVADDVAPQSIAGIMGGEESGVTLDTTSIIFECAVWDPVYIRRAARELNLASDSQSLFEKGLSTESCPIGIARAVELCLELAGGTVTSHLADVQTHAYKPQTYTTTLEEVCTLMGVEISLSEVKNTLTRLGFDVRTAGKKIHATVPWWRDHDIESGRDLIEEVARVYGYARIPATYPPATLPKTMERVLTLERRVRSFAASAGYVEAFNYSFISRELAEKAGFDAARMFHLQNPLSSDFEFMRTSLMPSILQTVAENQERFREQHLFELAHAYYLRDGKTNDLPIERPECVTAILYTESAFAEAKGFVEGICEMLGIRELAWKPLAQDLFWHPGRTAQLFVGESLLATVGEIHPQVTARFKIEGRVTSAHLLLTELFTLARPTKTYTSIPVFPEAKRDIAFLVDRDVSAEALTAAIRSTSPLIRHAEWFDTYRGKGISDDKKSLAFHLSFGVDNRTLETTEVDAAMQAIETALTKTLAAEWRK